MQEKQIILKKTISFILNKHIFVNARLCYNFLDTFIEVYGIYLYIIFKKTATYNPDIPR